MRYFGRLVIFSSLTWVKCFGFSLHKLLTVVTEQV